MCSRKFGAFLQPRFILFETMGMSFGDDLEMAVAHDRGYFDGGLRLVKVFPYDERPIVRHQLRSRRMLSRPVGGLCKGERIEAVG